MLTIFKFEVNSSLSPNSIDLFTFLNRIIRSIPIENSSAANPIINKLVDINVKSSLLAPHTIVYIYKVNHVISEKSSNLKKFSIFTINPIKDNQKKKFQKFIQVCNK